ncbi:MAG: T9SS type A sorting domain-containing protein, partial [Chitinophagaceae bacterium]
WTPVVGSYTLTATPYSATGGKGTAGAPLAISFTVTNQAPATITQKGDLNVATVLGQVEEQQKVYPNPSTTGRFTIQLSKRMQGEVVYKLFSQNGNQVTNGKLTLLRPEKILHFDFSNKLTTSGVYYLQLAGKNNSFIYKLTRQQ